MSMQKIGTKDVGYDIIAIGDKTYYIEVKFYRSTKVRRSLIDDVASTLASRIALTPGAYGIVIFNVDVPDELQKEVYERYKIRVWDRSTIVSELGNTNSGLLEEFEQLLLETDQGTDTFEMMVGSEVSAAIDQAIFPDSPPNKPGRAKNPRHLKALDLSKQLRELDCGKETWAAYERLIVEILRLLFKEDLTLWEKQQRTDDALSRFDLICRVNGFDDFWKSLIRSFNTRFILFEFKNYYAEVSQHQVNMVFVHPLWIMPVSIM